MAQEPIHPEGNSFQPPHQPESDRLQHQRTFIQQEIQELDTEIRQTRQDQQQTYGSLQQHLVKIDSINKDIARQNQSVSETEADIASLEERYKKAAPKYSLFAGLLYFVAGLSFVAGDLIISHEIVAYALNIRNTTEAWFFAVGLAMVSVLLKPVYDRLIEGPYLQNQEKSQKLYASFKITLAIFSVLTLFVLGWFRYEAYRTDKMKQAITQNIKNLQLQQADQTSASAILQVEKQMQQVDVLNQGLVTSPFALASFVLSGVLFAVAGAVCLGVSFPILQGFWFRWLQAGPKLKRLRKLRLQKQQRLAEIEGSLSEHLIQKGTLENKLSFLTPLTDLTERRNRLRQHLYALTELPSSEVSREARLESSPVRNGHPLPQRMNGNH
ncbi:hypothetical protein BWI93_11490 [Siphonobacter sp. BAB-5385]|uniref:hypothetical protein n=1 Tax=Siphonobacter sp. BAB-5385 TaxID=1864822 RepID=UPI000B9E6261|nr:hypothetical protein [Siphonobacter sp. BAB-5385]OZI08003.1 hypothetical protein BWI93_11490 [Siphonobacter sp. BAB-5385]